MKNVLFATTALVAMTGSAFAAGHGDNVSLVWSGDFEAGYNDEVTGGLYVDASLGLDVTVDFSDSVTGAIGFDLSSTGTTWSYVEFNYDSGSSLSAMLRFGDLNDEGASERYYADRSGMAVDVENHDGGSDVVAEVSFGSISVAAGCGVITNACDGLNVGVGATFGSIELGVGYDDATGGQTAVTAVSADASLGSIEVGVSYATSVAENSVGVEVSTTLGAIEVGAYYASNSASDDGYGVSVDYTAGALTIGVGYDNVDDGGAGTGRGEYGIDLAYAISDSLTANAGYFNGEADLYTALVATPTVGGYYYVGVDYTVNENISATLSYATADSIGSPEYSQGISAFITAEF